MYSHYKLESYTALVRKILGKKNYMLLNFVIFFDMTSSSILFIYFAAQIMIEIFSKYNVILPGWVQILLILVITILCFIMAFFDLQKISILSFVGKNYIDNSK